jgi:AraC-like DNA-binding protein
MDVLIRFKSPVKLKIFFTLFVLAILVGAFCSFFRKEPGEYFFLIKISRIVLGTSIVQIFTNLYFIQYKRIANIYTIAAYSFYTFLIFYIQIVGYDTVFTKSAILNNTYNLPNLLHFFIELDYISVMLFALYYIYNILFKFSYKNIYFKTIQIWTFCFFIVLAAQLFINLFSIIFVFPELFHILVRIFFSLFFLLIILYRPSFINKNGSKISFGYLFNKNDFSSAIKEVDFNFHFYTNFYFKNKTADIAEFSNIMGVTKDIMFNYIYFTYSMSFDDLVNKARVEYFVEIIKNEKYKNYTVEALALEVGFSSRQRFYLPFKKYHGGNPSDLIEIIND